VERLNAEIVEAAEPMSYRDEPPKWGVSHSIAYALAALNLDVVHRSTLRAMLPAGRIRGGVRDTAPAVSRKVSTRRVNRMDSGSRRLIDLGTATDFVPTPPKPKPKRTNVISEKFQDALLRFEREGWLSRGTEYVLVRDRRALFDWATSAVPTDDIEIPLELAIAQIDLDLQDAARMTTAAVEQRRRELIALKRLMEEDFGAGKGRVRLLPRSKPL
jgi:hypothetical protein